MSNLGTPKAGNSPFQTSLDCALKNKNYEKKILGDVISKIENMRTTTAPQEIRITGIIEHDAVMDAIEIEGVIDSGAGKSYLLLPERYPTLPVSAAESTIEVQFADGSSQTINSIIRVDLTLIATDEETTLSQEE